MNYGSDALAALAYFPQMPPRSAYRPRLVQLEEWQLCLREMGHSSEAFYVLPLELMNLVEDHFPKLDKSLFWWDERRVSEYAESISAVGFWRNQPIHTPLLATAAKSGVTPICHSAQQAYAGWLITQPMFWAEHDRVFEKQALSNNSVLGVETRFSFQRPATTRWREFLHRWRLSESTRPGLPIPQRVVKGRLAVANARALGQYDSLYSIPITMPLPDHSDLQQLGAETSLAHLAGWLELISPHNRASGSVTRKYPRWFLVHHYWQCLMRHASQFYREATVLHSILAELLGSKQELVGSTIDVDTIKKDCQSLGLNVPSGTFRSGCA